MPSAVLAGTFLASITKEEYERYNRELENFYHSYEDYYKVTELLRQAAERSFRVSFTLVNNGYSPAHEIDIHIHFPDGMDILDAANMPPGFKDRKPPDPPQEPRRDIDRMFDIGRIPSSVFDRPSFNMPNMTREGTNVSAPIIMKTSSYDVHFEVGKLKHGYSLELGELLILFPSRPEASSFAVEYRITADNHPDSQSGKLHFVLAN